MPHPVFLRTVPLLLGMAAIDAQTVGNCPVFPPNNVWNARVDKLPVHANSAAYVNAIGLTSPAHADFGSGTWEGEPIGIPYVIVPGSQPKVPITFQYAGESDPGPYPIPANAPIEGGSSSTGDRHVLVIDGDNCILYEIFNAKPQLNGSWTGGSGAVFNLHSNALRPATWTSADAAGLPIFPGLARYSEVAAGLIRHALRFTAPYTQEAFIWPARHQASNISSTNYPPMGQRFRLKASFDISSFSPQTKVVLQALKTYGMILADNGSAWYVSGAPDPGWNNDDLHEMGNLTGADFEAVNESGLMLNANSAQVVGGYPPMLIWQDDSTRQVTVQYYGGSGGATFESWDWLNSAGVAGWHVAAVADFNGDGMPDLVWQNDSTRQVTVNYYGGPNGATYLGWNWLDSTGEAGWHVAGAADFDRNGVPDLVWQNDATGQVIVHYYGGTGGATLQGWNWLNQSGVAGWQIAAVADVNGDGVPDLIWQNESTRQVTVNYYGGTGGATVQGWNWLQSSSIAGWHVAAATDFNGDGVPDLVWQNDSTRQVTVHYYAGAGGAVYQGWNWLNVAGVPGWSVVY